VRLESTFWQTPLHWHLTAFEAHFVVASRARFLTFVTPTGSFAQTGPDTTADTALGVFGAIGVFDSY
jgi:hypothetical protein